ncbi:caspase-3-like isoform X2 [Cyclopterus lumpus]|uniref:caspase-3-like isoform X2 n=1 Tax=Cyclopterus lumpus TaxID=8103 RepID=UPI001486BB7A|nr:caspase-3-like isoform X2 [Cyclopterus lumpus]
MDLRGDRNRAVLVSVEQFDPGVRLGRRPGAGKDAKTLHRTLSKLGFKVDIHTDRSRDEIYELFLKESQRPVKDCFLAVLSSHGDEGCVFGADGKPVQLSLVFTYFDNDYMDKKVKVFLIQACRGAGLDDGVEVDSAGDTRECSFSHNLSVPVDTAVMIRSLHAPSGISLPPDVLHFIKAEGQSEPGADPPADTPLPHSGLPLPGQRWSVWWEEGDAVPPEPTDQRSVSVRRARTLGHRQRVNTDSFCQLD